MIFPSKWHLCQLLVSRRATRGSEPSPKSCSKRFGTAKTNVLLSTRITDAQALSAMNPSSIFNMYIAHLCCDPIVQRLKQLFCTWARQYAETVTSTELPKNCEKKSACACITQSAKGGHPEKLWFRCVGARWRPTEEFWLSMRTFSFHCFSAFFLARQKNRGLLLGLQNATKPTQRIGFMGYP